MKQVCDTCQHLYLGPVCEECFPNELDAKNQIIKVLEQKLEASRTPINWPTDKEIEDIDYGASASDCYTLESRRGFFAGVEWLKSFVEKRE